MLHPFWEWTMPSGADVPLPEIDKLESELEEALQPKLEGCVALYASFFFD